MTEREHSGLNGRPVLTVKDMPVGRVDGEPYGYGRPLLVTVDIRMEHRTDESETVDHDTVSDYLDFAITASVWQPGKRDIVSGGATVEPLREVLASERYSDGMSADKVRELAALEQWHLNALTAGCDHQTVVWEDNPRYGYRQPSLDNTPACPQTGYRYGHKWLVRQLPDGFLDKVRGLFADSDQTRIYDSGYTNERTS